MTQVFLNAVCNASLLGHKCDVPKESAQCNVGVLWICNNKVNKMGWSNLEFFPSFQDRGTSLQFHLFKVLPQSDTKAKDNRLPLVKHKHDEDKNPAHGFNPMESSPTKCSNFVNAFGWPHWIKEPFPCSTVLLGNALIQILQNRFYSTQKLIIFSIISMQLYLDLFSIKE